MDDNRKPDGTGALAPRAETTAEVHARVSRLLQTAGYELGVRTLMEIAGDKTAPKAPRVMASKALSDLGGAVADGAQTKDLHEMTREELRAAADEARARLAELEAPVIDGEAVRLPSVFD